MPAKLTPKLQTLQDRVRAIGNVRTATATMLDGLAELFRESKDNPEEIEILCN